MLGSNFQGGAITNLALNGSILSNTLPVTGTFSVANSTLFGSYLVTSGAVFSLYNGGGIGVTVDGQVTVENGGEMLLSAGGNGIDFSDSDDAHTNNWLWLQRGAQMIGDSGFFNLGSHMTNSGICSLTNGFIDNGNGGLVNLAGGVINLISGASIYGYAGFDYLMNEGTINVTDGTSEIGLGLGLLTGTYNAAAGATVQFVTDRAAGTSPGPGLTLGGSGQYQFFSGLLTVASYPIPNLMIGSGATLALAADFQGGTITNLALDGITLSNTLPVTGTFSVTNGTLLGSYLMTSGAVLSAIDSVLYGSYFVTNGGVLTVGGVTVDAQVTVENGGELQLLTNAVASSIGDGAYGFDSPNYWLWLQDGARMTAPSGFQLYVLSPMTNSGTCSLTNGQILINNDNFYFFGGLVNLPGGVIDLINGAGISGGFGLDYLLNEGEISVFSASTNSIISVDYFTNAATLSAEHGTLELESTNLILEPSGTLRVGLNSATDFGSIVYSNTAILNLAQAGTFQVTLNGGYVPAVNTTFQVLSASSSGTLSGAFGNFSSPDGAIWQTNYTGTSLVLTNGGQITWATPANITYGTAVNASQLNASTTPTVTGTFTYNPVAGTVLNSGAGQLLTATFTPFNPSYAPASFQVPITVLQAPLSVIATNQTKTYGQTFSFAGTEFVASGLVNGDTVTSASLASAGAISNAPVSDSPYAITINSALGDAGLTNYIITYTNGTLTVNAAPLGITANSTGKTYGSNVIFAGTEFVSTPLQNSETIGTVTLTSAGAISNAPVSGSPYSIVPSAATGGTFSPGNYAITYTNGTLTVNRAGLTVTANPASRDYGAANPAFSATYSGFVNGETISVVSGAPGFSTPATVTNGLGNYMITPSFGSLTAADYTFGPFVNGTLAITTAPVTITSGITANNKVYDRITTATLSSNSVVLLGIANGDAVSLNTNGYVANFVSGGVGSSIAVTLNGLTLSGARATNYSLTQPASLTASITAATVTINSGITANNKVYDRTTTATLSSNNVVLMGVVTGDSVTINTNGYVANFANGSVGNNIAVTVGGLTLSGASAANYALTQPASLTANITAATVTIASGITANNKVYNGTTTATINSNNVVLVGIVTGDSVTLNTNGYVANFANGGVGNNIAVSVAGLTLSGASAANYVLTQPASLTANITSATVTIASGLTANNKVYDRTTTATLTSNNVVLLGVIIGDTVSLNTNGYIASFASAGLGSGIAVSVSGLALNGASTANYALTQPLALTANITAPGVQIVADLPNIAISWPTNATIFVLNQTASLTPPVTWSPVTNSITVNGTDNTVTINTSTSEDQYFELVGAP